MIDDLDSDDRPRKGLRDYKSLAIRRRWYLLGPLFACGLGGFVLARTWPLLYRSEALILVEQQKVPEQYVIPNVTANLQNRLDSMTQQILSRTRLQRLIEDFNLYAKERSRSMIDDVIDVMRKHISVEPVITQSRLGDLTSFRIFYSADNPHIAQKVTNELTSLFIEENLRARTQQSANTTTFLENQLEAARKDLEHQEQQLREYKLRYLGELPEQQQSNLQILSSLEAQLRAVTDALGRAEQQKVYLESLRTEYQSLNNSLAEANGAAETGYGAVRNLTPSEIALQTLRRQLAELKTKYTAEHPDIHQIEEQISELETATSLGPKSATDAKDKPSRAQSANRAQPSLIEAESRLRAIAMEIENRKKETEDLRVRIQESQKHLSLTPVREQQLAEVTRTHGNARANYQSLLQKKLQSELASNLEKRQQGEVFRILDPASLPMRPVGRIQIVVFSWIAGLCVGFVLIAVRELFDSTVRSEEEVGRCLPFPVILRIPSVRSPRQELHWKWYKRFEVTAVGLLFLISVGLGIHLYFIT